jgi:hypothetical protein
VKRFTMLALAAIVAAFLAAAPGASAAKVKLGGGSTTLKLDAGTAKALTDAGASVAPLRPARVRGGGVAFPITGGSIDPTNARGRIDHSGGLVFRAGGQRVAIRNFRVHVGAKRAILTAAAGNARLTVLSLNLSKARVKRPGLGTTVTGVRAVLAGQAAKALNAAFGVSLFSKGLPIGKVTVKATPAEVALAGASTALVLDPGTASALTSLGITPGLVDPATARSDGFNFPITGGKVNATTFAGRISHSGGISLTRGSTRVELTRFVINVDSAPDLTALVGGDRVSILNLDLSALDAQVRGRRITLSGVKGTLTAAAAGALNQAFSTNAFSEGLVIGTATVKARAR